MRSPYSESQRGKVGGQRLKNAKTETSTLNDLAPVAANTSATPATVTDAKKNVKPEMMSLVQHLNTQVELLRAKVTQSVSALHHKTVGLEQHVRDQASEISTLRETVAANTSSEVLQAMIGDVVQHELKKFSQEMKLYIHHTQRHYQQQQSVDEGTRDLQKWLASQLDTMKNDYTQLSTNLGQAYEAISLILSHVQSQPEPAGDRNDQVSGLRKEVAVLQALVLELKASHFHTSKNVMSVLGARGSDLDVVRGCLNGLPTPEQSGEFNVTKELAISPVPGTARTQTQTQDEDTSLTFYSVESGDHEDGDCSPGLSNYGTSRDHLSDNDDDDDGDSTYSFNSFSQVSLLIPSEMAQVGDTDDADDNGDLKQLQAATMRQWSPRRLFARHKRVDHMNVINQARYQRREDVRNSLDQGDRQQQPPQLQRRIQWRHKPVYANNTQNANHDTSRTDQITNYNNTCHSNTIINSRKVLGQDVPRQQHQQAQQSGFNALRDVDLEMKDCSHAMLGDVDEF